MLHRFITCVSALCAILYLDFTSCTASSVTVIFSILMTSKIFHDFGIMLAKFLVIGISDSFVTWHYIKNR